MQVLILRCPHLKILRGIFNYARLDIPYRSQEDNDAWGKRNDCGPACAAMLLNWKGKHYRIDDLSGQTALAQNDNGLTCAQVSNLLNKLGVPTYVTTRNTDQLQNEIEAGNPIICLIRYADIPGRQSTYGGGHFIVVTGYDENNFWCNDPDWYGSRRNEGKDFRIPKNALEMALKNSPAPYQVICLR